MTLVRISPDGKEVVHLYDDNLFELTSKTADIEVERASDIFFDNEKKNWKVRILKTGEVLPASFKSREGAKTYEISVLESRLRTGESCV